MSEVGEINSLAWDKLIEEVNWLREAYTHKCSEVGYLSGVADRMKWLRDQSREQITSLKVQNEHLKEELEECEYLRKKLIEQINVEPKATKKSFRTFPHGKSNNSVEQSPSISTSSVWF
ncbi:9455_t:CDS:2, partial [Funneliformis mosseae]